jgi:hypothetical protein
MSEEVGKQLQRIKGIGAVLVKRLVAAGIDSPARLARAAPEELAAIPGMNPRYIPEIIEQAGRMASQESQAEGATDKSAALLQTAQTLRVRVRDLAEGLLARKGEIFSDEKKAAIEKEVKKFLARLERVESRLDGRRKRARKGLARAARRLQGLDQAGAGKLMRGLKKARKSFKRIQA